MTATNDSSSAAETSPAPKEKEKAKGKKGRAAPDPAQLTRSLLRLDRALVGVVLLLTFLLASFVARNSDYFLHLATGRFFADGKYTFGVDPFAYTTGGVYWVNSSWLYDWLLYHLTMLAGGPEAAGGTVAIVLKALAMTGLAALLMQLRRPAGSLYVPASCTGLAILAMAPRMTLQPVVVSLLFLGLTLYFLIRDGKRDPSPGTRGWRLLFTASPARLYALPVLFALWANLDGWFLLGPILVALYLLGEKLQELIDPERTGSDAPAPHEQRTLALVLGAGTVACLLNPHHFHIFTTLPVELFASMRFPALLGDGQFTRLFLSPFNAAYFTPAFGAHVCGVAYFPLLALGPVSFWLTRTHWRIWRLLIWTALAALSAWNMQLVPFFAVVAAPITALNLQDFAAAHMVAGAQASLAVLQRQVALRGITLLLGVGLLIAAVPGWLQPHYNNPVLARRVGWGVELDPSLKAAAYKLDYWHTAGLLRPEDHGFNLTPAVAHYCAWFCPDEKGFLDHRLALFGDAVAAYVDVRYVLLTGAGPGGKRRGPGPSPDWQQTLREHGITHIILNSPTLEGVAPLVTSFLTRGGAQWTMLFLDGRTAVFGWNDPKRAGADTSTGPRLDWKAQAFGATVEQAPEQGPGRPPRALSWWEQLVLAPERSVDGERASMQLAYYNAVRDQRKTTYRDRQFPVLACAALFGTASPTIGPVPFLSAFLDVWNHGGALRDAAPLDRDRGPPEALLLAVRSARRALAENPDDVEAYRALAPSTDALWISQENHWAHTRLSGGLHPVQLVQLLREKKRVEPFLSPWLTGALNTRHLLRRAQEVTALQHILAAQPDAQEVHHVLAGVYLDMNFYDAALDHLRQEIRCLEAAAQRFKDNKELQRTLEQRRKEFDPFEKAVDEVQRQYEFAAASKPPKVQALLAFRPFGLARQSLAALLREDLTQMGPEEVDLVIYLHLTLGRAEELRGQLTEGQQKLLGPVLYARYRAVQAAAVGDYREADDFLRQAQEAVPRAKTPPVLNVLQAMLFDRFQPTELNRRVLRPFLQAQSLRANELLAAQQHAREFQVLRGLMALEVGDNAMATQHFREAVEAPALGSDFESRPIAVHYLKLLRER